MLGRTAKLSVVSLSRAPVRVLTAVRHNSFMGLPIYSDPKIRKERKETAADPRFPEKISTGVTGLDVVPNARAVYLKQCKKILRELKLNLPVESRYRWLMERTYTFREKVLEQEEDPREVERRLNSGQLEELIEEGHTVLQQIPIEMEEKDWIQDPDNPQILLWSRGNSTI